MTESMKKQAQLKVDTLLTIEEAAELLSVDADTISTTMIQAGQLEAFEGANGAIRISESSVFQCLEERS